VGKWLPNDSSSFSVRASSLMVRGKARVVWTVGSFNAFPASASAATMRRMLASVLMRVSGLVVRTSTAIRASSITTFSASPAWMLATVTTAVSYLEEVWC
jgi:hypothetical protein